MQIHSGVGPPYLRSWTIWRVELHHKKSGPDSVLDRGDGKGTDVFSIRENEGSGLQPSLWGCTEHTSPSRTRVRHCHILRCLRQRRTPRTVLIHCRPCLGPPLRLYSNLSIFFSPTHLSQRLFQSLSWPQTPVWQVVLSCTSCGNEKPWHRSFPSAQHRFSQLSCSCPPSLASLLLQGWSWPSSFLRTPPLPAFSRLPSTVTISPSKNFHQSPILKIHLPCYQIFYFRSSLPFLLLFPM